MKKSFLPNEPILKTKQKSITAMSKVSFLPAGNVLQRTQSKPNPTQSNENENAGTLTSFRALAVKSAAGTPEKCCALALLCRALAKRLC
jgi:hypothetical protein